MANLVELMKIAANEANSATNPSGVYFGTVAKENPLEINVEQKMNLTESFLILTNAVKDHYIDISVSHVTENTNIDHRHVVEGTTDSADIPPHNHSINITSNINDSTTEHLHAYKGRKKILVHNALKAGEKVILIRMQGGQKFLVLDRLGDPVANGQWV